VPDLDVLRRLAPPVDPASAETRARARARLERVQTGRARRRPRRLRLAAAPAVLGVGCALALVVTQLGGDRSPAFAAAAVRAAESSPRLLVDGWKVTRADEVKVGEGELTATAADGRELELSWYPTSPSEPAWDKDSDPGVAVAASVPGGRTVIRRYAGTDDYTAFWHDGATTVRARGNAASPDAFHATLALLERVSVDAWLRAMPADAVTPAQHSGAVDAMLAGLPLPPGFDRDALRASHSTTRDRYQLGAAVAGAVACGWIADWVRATAAGDGAAAGRAADALATSRGWPILREMTAAGDYPKVLWQYADAVRGDGTVVGGKPLTVAESYKDALGC
jgi:hypothetical protein